MAKLEIASEGASSHPVRGGPPPGEQQAASAGGWVLPLVVLVAGMFMSVLDTSIVNVAIPTIQNDFGVSTDDAQWVLTGYTLALGVVVPLTAWLGNRFGLSRVYNLALLGFATGSALCGLAWDLNSLVTFRIIQAIPGGILPVITLSMLYQIVPRDRLGSAMGLYGLGVVFAPAVGPALGGYLVEYVSWRLIFYINVPIGILGAIAAILVLPRFPGRVGQRFDALGFLTIAGGLFVLLLAVSKGQSWGWYSYPILGLITIGVFSLALFVVIELEVDEPLLDLRIFRYWAFTQSLLLISMLTIALFGVLFYIPQFLQVAQGWEALDAGLTLLPQALVMALLMPIAGRIYDRIGPRWPAVIGLATAAYGIYLLRTLTLYTPREHVMWLLMVQAAGIGTAMMPIMSGGIAAIPPTHVNAASAFNNVARNVAGALGVAMLTAVLTIHQAQQTAGRAALLPATTPIPHLGPPRTPEWVSVYALYQLTQKQVFVAAIDDLFLISAGICALSALAALLLRSGPATTSPAGSSPPAADTASQPPIDSSPGEQPAVPTTMGEASPGRPPDRATGLTAETSSKQALAELKTAQQTRDQTIPMRDQAGFVRLPDQQSCAHGRTGAQKPKLGPRQAELARQMFEEFDKNGKRRYTVQQIAAAFGVTPAELDVGLQRYTRRTKQGAR